MSFGMMLATLYSTEHNLKIARQRMTTDLAFHHSRILRQQKDIKNVIDTIYPIDHSLVLNALQDIDTEEYEDTSNLWRLTKAALATVRNLQNDLNAAKVALDAKDARIDLLERLATTDTLTGLHNRHGFFDNFEKELDRVNRHQAQNGILIMIDMDNFKTINDTYGHRAGDEALCLVAQTLTAHIRKMDVAGRIGGDEFVLLFANVDPIDAVDRVQKLARKLNALTLKWQGERIKIRASVGIQSYKKGDSIHTIFDKADARMYQAKAQRKEKERALIDA